uniref:Uncharacterized protein n=1 Tax=viral metagenome TaxID=1070528 RepID=A0A6C0F8R4_9ZZZZ|tara:strand:+ start:468 stop:686 length:219 start_codon:yes stop_codon:yes gene_type:complete
MAGTPKSAKRKSTGFKMEISGPQKTPKKDDGNKDEDGNKTGAKAGEAVVKAPRGRPPFGKKWNGKEYVADDV